MKESAMDSVIVFDELNQRYLSDIAFTDGYLFITLNKAYIVTDFRYFEMATKSSAKGFEVVMPEDREKFLANVISTENIKTIGFEGGFVSFELYKHYEENSVNHCVAADVSGDHQCPETVLDNQSRD